MRLTRTLLFLATAVAATGCDQMPMSNQAAKTESPAAAASTDTSPVVATVNGAPITLNLFDVYEKQRHQNRPSDAGDPTAVLDEIVSLELAAQDGIKAGLDKTPDIQAQIEQQRRAVIASAALKKELDDHPVTDEEMQAFYKEKTANLGSEFKARHILVADESKAKKLITELDKGADFSELAKKNSTDSSASNGGDLGWFSPKQMVKPFSDAVAQLEKGKYTEQPVQTQFGWHIIMLDDKRDITPPPFDQIKRQIQMVLQNQRVQKYVQSLHEQAKIEVNQENLPKPAAAPTEGESGAAAPAESAPSEADQPAASEGDEDEPPAENANQ